MTDDNERLTGPEEEDFVASVLRRTSGAAACRRAEELLCGYADGELEEDDRALVEVGLADLAASLRLVNQTER